MARSTVNAGALALLLGVLGTLLATTAWLALAAFGMPSMAWPSREQAAPAPDEEPGPSGALAPERLVSSVSQALMPVSREDALRLNASVPEVDEPLAVAQPLVVRSADPRSLSRARECLAAAVYYEAASESASGQRAVAQVVLNRVHHPAFPATICGVVFEGSERRTGCQFSFTCDGSLRRAPAPAAWSRALAVADAALAGYVEPSVGMATHYHTDWVVPYWSSSMVKLRQLGTHIFFRWPGRWGDVRHYAQRYNPVEPPIAWAVARAGEAAAPQDAAYAEPPGTGQAVEAGRRPLLSMSDDARESGEAASPAIPVHARYRRVLGLPGSSDAERASSDAR
ncbi:hypothetical protein B2G71_05985 [Novosphingobium sp. PC22D]|uniref:cell wall hydrolase n=1 Tax=Novosphingobium sp. PC22D TaxID=1962403 RepID=UPI000BFAC762|nr:hypothetical protein B2G71_05985 [Novosphingobium sp. PC22D]